MMKCALKSANLRIFEKMNAKLFPLLFVLAMVSATAAPRAWTAKDGRVIQAEFISATKDSVSVRRNDGAAVLIPLALLSDEDVAWVGSQPKPVEVSQGQLDKVIAAFPKAPALTTGEVTNDLQQLHDKYEGMVKFIRPNTVIPNLKMIRNKLDADIKVLGEIAKTSSGDWTGKRGSTQSRGAESGILSARRSLSWLQGTLTTYLLSFDALAGNSK